MHQARDEWHQAVPTVFPCVPSHEIIGQVTNTGRYVRKFKKWDYAAVGCMVNSCRNCANCNRGLKQYCLAFFTFTYNSSDKQTGGVTLGGYSEAIVVFESFTLRVSEKANLAAMVPLLCAGITSYSPLRHWKMGPGQKVGTVGLGALGHMGVKFAGAFGAHVVLFTPSPYKVEEGKRPGAHEVVVSGIEKEMKAHAGSFDFKLDCV